jgi:uncharacterized protein (DUF58 family)
MGQSFELGVLRPYQYGESIGRVSWRASARVGELVIQHFQQSGSVRLRVGVEVPHEPSLGDATGTGEQAIRLAAGVCHAALANSAQLFLYLGPHSYLEHEAEPVCDASAVLRALSKAAPHGGGLFQVITQIASAVMPGEQVAVVVSATSPAAGLVDALGALTVLDCRVLVCIALGRLCTAIELAQARALQQALQQAGLATFMEAP